MLGRTAAAFWRIDWGTGSGSEFCQDQPSYNSYGEPENTDPRKGVGNGGARFTPLALALAASKPKG